MPVWVIGQVLLVSLALVWMLVAGLRRLWRSGRPLWQALVWAYGLLYVLYAFTTGAKIYYLAAHTCTCSPPAPWPLTAGFSHEPAASASHGRYRADHRAVAVLMLPVLPPTGIGPEHTMEHPRRDSRLARTRRHRCRRMEILAAQQQANAVDLHRELRRSRRHQRTRPGQGPAHAVSGHNSQWWWGPGNPDATTVIAVAPGAASDIPATSPASSPTSWETAT